MNEWNPLTFRAALLLLVALSPAGCARTGTSAAGPAVRPETAPGYIARIPPEPPEDRIQRHRKVAERRRDIVIMVHRGASAIAPENTLEAYAAAMDLGADGCEIDIRRSADGVLYLHHDDSLGRTVRGSEKVSTLSYYGLVSRPLARTYGPADRDTRIPTLAALLVLARQRAMLLHLDIKEGGIEEDIRRMIDEADMWDHIVLINPSPHSDRIRLDPRLKQLHYKGWLNEAGAGDEAMQAFLARPQQMIFTKDDPTAAVRLLKRRAPAAVALPEGLRIPWMADGPVQAAEDAPAAK